MEESIQVTGSAEVAIDNRSNSDEKSEDEQKAITGEIYIITCTVTGKQYVGQARHYVRCKESVKRHGMMARWGAHLREAARYAKTKVIGEEPKNRSILNNAILKYGKDAFVVEKLEDCEDLETLNNAEQQWIQTMDTMVPNGYNIRPGGNSFKHSEGSRKKQSELIETHYAKKRREFFKDKIIIRAVMRDVKANGGESKPHVRVYVYYNTTDNPNEQQKRTNFQYNDGTKEDAWRRATEFANSLSKNVTIEEYHQKHTGACNKMHFANKRKEFFKDKIIEKIDIFNTNSNVVKCHIDATVYYTTPGDENVRKKDCYFFYNNPSEKNEAKKKAIEFAQTMTQNVYDKVRY